MTVLSVISINDQALFYDVKRINDVITAITQTSLPSENRLNLFIEEMNKRGLNKFTVEKKENLDCADVFVRGLKLPLCTVDSKQ